MIEVTCSGTPYQIGHQHGTAARAQVHGSKAFYTDFFMSMAKLEWDAVCDEAAKWMPLLEREYPQYVEEMQGIADATDLPLASIVALNVRTEVAFGLFSDGCTSLAYHASAPTTALLAQNWDWKSAQGANLVHLSIRSRTTAAGAPSTAPAIDIITEAGIIGKIGLSAAGLGVCLNAITALGVDHTRVPVHIALRAALDWSGEGASVGMARRIADRLRTVGVAAAAHILLSDAHEAIGLETSCIDTAEVPPIRLDDGAVAVVHSNHYVVPHPGVKPATNFMEDSPVRLERIDKLVREDEGAVNASVVQGWLCDTCGFPASICRDGSSKGGSETLFSIVMDLRDGVREARVTVGKPNLGGGEVLMLRPE